MATVVHLLSLWCTYTHTTTRTCHNWPLIKFAAKMYAFQRDDVTYRHTHTHTKPEGGLAPSYSSSSSSSISYIAARWKACNPIPTRREIGFVTRRPHNSRSHMAIESSPSYHGGTIECVCVFFVNSFNPSTKRHNRLSIVCPWGV